MKTFTKNFDLVAIVAIVLFFAGMVVLAVVNANVVNLM